MGATDTHTRPPRFNHTLHTHIHTYTRTRTHVDGHEARDDGAGDAGLPAAGDVGEEDVGVVEELRDDEVRPGVDLFLEVADLLVACGVLFCVVLWGEWGVGTLEGKRTQSPAINSPPTSSEPTYICIPTHPHIPISPSPHSHLVQVHRRRVAPVLQVPLGVACHGDAEVVPVLRPDEPHQVDGVREAALHADWFRLGFMARLNLVLFWGGGDRDTSSGGPTTHDPKIQHESTKLPLTSHFSQAVAPLGGSPRSARMFSMPAARAFYDRVCVVVISDCDGELGREGV